MPWNAIPRATNAATPRATVTANACFTRMFDSLRETEGNAIKVSRRSDPFGLRYADPSMRVHAGRRSCSPTDLANFIACRHKSCLDLATAEGRLPPPVWEDPLVERLRARGDAHEQQYIAALRATGRTIT